VAEVTPEYAIEQSAKWLSIALDGIKLLKGEVVSQPTEREIAWGKKVSPTFKERILWIGETLRVNPDYLMSCIAWESGESFAPDKRNMAGSGATGLIQFMPATAKALGTTVDELAKMSAEDQLNYVYKYFKPFNGRLNNLGDVYMAILWPKAVGQDDSFVLFDKGVAYRQNAGLDIDKNGNVTRGECLEKIKDKLAKGLGTRYRG
jgi:hypothetical protein